ncbi:unnamed protein product, partial [Prorocentrum cordatum]
EDVDSAMFHYPTSEVVDAKLEAMRDAVRQAELDRAAPMLQAAVEAEARAAAELRCVAAAAVEEAAAAAAREVIERQARSPQRAEGEICIEATPEILDTNRQYEAAVRIQASQRERKSRRDARVKRHASSPQPAGHGRCAEWVSEAVDDDQQHQAAVRIQAIQRGRIGRRDVLFERHASCPQPAEHGLVSNVMAIDQQQQAAVRIQAAQRGRRDRRDVCRERRASPPLSPALRAGAPPVASAPLMSRDADQQHQAAARMQSIERGRNSRRDVRCGRHASSRQSDEDGRDGESTLDTVVIDQQHQAAVRIQAAHRGRRGRRDARAERRASSRRPAQGGGAADVAPEAQDVDQQQQASDSDREDECVSGSLAAALLDELLGAAAEARQERPSVETVQALTSRCASVGTLQGGSSACDDQCGSDVVGEVLLDQLLHILASQGDAPAP